MELLAVPDASEAERAAPEFRLRVNGRDLPPETQTDVTSIAMHEDLDLPGMFTFDMINWDANKLKVKWSDSEDFKPGVSVDILMGYRDQAEKIFSGEITGCELRIHGRETPLLRLRGYDRRHRLMRGRKSAVYHRMKDSDIASQIANHAGLRPETDDTSVQHEHIYQHNQTDLEFLNERASLLDYEVLVDDRKLLFRRRRNDQSEALTLDREVDLIEFYPRLTTMNQVGEISLRSWDAGNKAVITSSASAGQENAKMGGSTSGPSMASGTFGSSTGVSVRRPVDTQEEADQFTKARLNDMALSFVTGDGVCIGKPKLRAGTVIKIAGLGDRFSGLYYVISTVHSYTGSRGYRTGFTFRRNST
jgi:phage protein D